MSNRLPSAPTPKNFADTWVKEILEPAVQSLAGADGQIERADLEGANLEGIAAFAEDNLQNVFAARRDVSSLGVDALLEAGRRYAFSRGTAAAGGDGRISQSDAAQLPADLRSDFDYLRTGEGMEGRLNTQGYRFSKRVLADIAEKYGVTDQQTLIDKAIERGSSDKYLNKSELDAAGKALEQANETPSTPGFRWTPSVMARVLSEHNLSDEDALLMEAAKHDDGNRYLKRSELEAAAKILAGQVVESEQEIGIISDLDKTIIPKHGRNDDVPAPYPGIQAILHELEFGNGGEAGDITYVTARGADRVTEIPEYLEEHNIPTGPIETGTSTMPWIAGPEKVRDASRAFDANPEQSFVLFGDSSHRDPEVYKELKAKYPGRVKAAFIHKVNNTVSPGRVEGLHLIENYAEAAAIMFREGIVDEAAARRIMVSAQVEGLDITDAQIDTLINENRPS